MEKDNNSNSNSDDEDDDDDDDNNTCKVSCSLFRRNSRRKSSICFLAFSTF